MPWVAQSTLDQLRADVLAERAALDAARNTADARYADLLEKYHALRVAGANTADAAPPRAERAEPDPVTQAIIKRSGGNPLLRKHYAEYVRDQRSAGTADEDIAKSILEGQSLVDEGIPA